jgi:hypothetical protein
VPDLPPCLARPLVEPNDLLLKPEYLQNLVCGLLARGWSAARIAALVEREYLADHRWGDRWARLDARTRADFDVRVFAGLVLTGHNRLIDFNCVSSRKKGICPESGCGHDLDDGTTLVVESPLPHLIGGAPAEFAFVIHDLPASVGVCLDTGHAALGHHWHALVEIAGARLRHVHASDNHGHRDDHLPPGLGTIDWTAIASSLRAAHFDGWIMLELSCPPVDPIDTYLREAYVRAIDRLAL